MAKGEIAHNEQFFLLPQYFQMSSAAEASGSICVRERGKGQGRCHGHNIRNAGITGKHLSQRVNTRA